MVQLKLYMKMAVQRPATEMVEFGLKIKMDLS